MEQFALASFNATIRFSVLCLAGLLLAALWSGNDGSVLFALAACAAAYLSQFFTTLVAMERAAEAEAAKSPQERGHKSKDTTLGEQAALAACMLSIAMWCLGAFNLVQ